MKHEHQVITKIAIVVTPNFNLSATMAFIDPFRAANYLDGQTQFVWELISLKGGLQTASNGLQLDTIPLKEVDRDVFDMVLVSSSWTPELYSDRQLTRALLYWSNKQVVIGALDTGAFILAQAGLLDGYEATVHYEHLDAFIELFPQVKSSEQLCVFDGDRISCAGGVASVDFALHIMVRFSCEILANKAAQYIFHSSLRGLSVSQCPDQVVPLGASVPLSIRNAISVMENYLETPVSVLEICHKVGISQRQLGRLFSQYVGKSPSRYYLDIRLDRARGLVTQTAMPLSQVSVAAGFRNTVHFSRAYRKRFGCPPSRDRVVGKVPFEFRAWPMHRQPKRID